MQRFVIHSRKLQKDRIYYNFSQDQRNHDLVIHTHTHTQYRTCRFFSFSFDLFFFLFYLSRNKKYGEFPLLPRGGHVEYLNSRCWKRGQAREVAMQTAIHDILITIPLTSYFLQNELSPIAIPAMYPVSVFHRWNGISLHLIVKPVSLLLLFWWWYGQSQG